MTKLLHKDLTGRIIGVYYNVYNKLGQTYPEYIYEQAMMYLLREENISCTRQPEYEVWYKDHLVGKQRLDIFVADEVVVELKVADEIAPIHLAQILSYLKTLSKEVGLLFRFGGPKPDFVRRVLTAQTWSDILKTEVNSPTPRDDLLYPEVTEAIIGGGLEVFKTLGPGFIHRIYANACYRELKERGLEVKPHHSFHVFMDNYDLGTIYLKHLQVDSRILVFPVALADVSRIKIANLKAWMRYLGISLGILINFQTTWLEPIIFRSESPTS